MDFTDSATAAETASDMAALMALLTVPCASGLSNSLGVSAFLSFSPNKPIVVLLVLP
jgi:hypothetical protein